MCPTNFCHHYYGETAYLPTHSSLQLPIWYTLIMALAVQLLPLYIIYSSYSSHLHDEVCVEVLECSCPFQLFWSVEEDEVFDAAVEVVTEAGEGVLRPLCLMRWPLGFSGPGEKRSRNVRLGQCVSCGQRDDLGTIGHETCNGPFLMVCNALVVSHERQFQPSATTTHGHKLPKTKSWTSSNFSAADRNWSIINYKCFVAVVYI